MIVMGLVYVCLGDVHAMLNDTEITVSSKDVLEVFAI